MDNVSQTYIYIHTHTHTHTHTHLADYILQTELITAQQMRNFSASE